MHDADRKGPVLALLGFVAAATLYPLLAILVGFVAIALFALGLPRISVRSPLRALRRHPRPAVASFGVVGLAFLIGSLPAVLAVANGTTNLTNSNVSVLQGTLITVIVSHDGGGNAIFTVQFVSAPVTNTALGIDKFYYNDTWHFVSSQKVPDNPITAVSDPGCPGTTITGTNWKVNFDSSTADGFGTFGSLQSACAGGDGGISNPIAFRVSGDPTIAANANGAHYAVHIRFQSANTLSCSGFISDGTSSSVLTGTQQDVNGDGGGGCTPTVQVPGVTDILVPMAGLVTLVWFVGRRSKGNREA